MESLAKKYPKYYKALPPGVAPDAIDTYAIALMFPVDDPTGCILHARKKLLIPGVRSGGKSMLKDVTEARDTLNRYIAMMEAAETPVTLAPAPGTVVEDGWIVHGGNEMPEALDGDELVEVRVDGGDEYTGNFAKLARDWKWFTDGRCLAITHYRLLKVIVDVSPHGVVDEGLALVGDPGWYSHTPGPRPGGVGPNDLVQVRLSNGHEVAVPRKAAAWDWAYTQIDNTKAPHIEAWRFA